MHNCFFAHHYSRDLISISTSVIVQEMKSHVYAYTFSKTEEVPITLAVVCSAGVYAWDRPLMMRVPPERPPSSPVHPVLQQKDELEVVESLNDDGSAAIGIRRFKQASYKCIDI